MCDRGGGTTTTLHEEQEADAGSKSGAKIFDADGWVSKVRFVESRFERDQK